MQRHSGKSIAAIDNRKDPAQKIQTMTMANLTPQSHIFCILPDPIQEAIATYSHETDRPVDTVIHLAIALFLELDTPPKSPTPA